MSPPSDSQPLERSGLLEEQPGVLRVGIDVGGTFTDAIQLDIATGDLVVVKVPTTLTAVQASTLTALDKLSDSLRSVDSIVHGTTLVTNALVERNTPPIGLLTTRGFRDVLEIRRTQRPRLYDARWAKPPSLIPRHLRLEVRERIDKSGQVLEQLSEEEVRHACLIFAANKVRDIAIAFLFSFTNPSHEQQAARIVEQILPEARISLSSQVLPELREYERTSTTVLNAMARSVINDYLHEIDRQLFARSFTGRLRILKADGGIARSDYISKRSIEAFGSGPAGGVSAATRLGQALNRRNILTLDMGGTTTDVSLIWDGNPVATMEEEVEFGIPIRIPMIYIKSIGAGGGSIVRLDDAGVLHVGPKSSGADPGPACYGRGGLEPTLTDATLVLGWLDPTFFLGGRMPLDRELAERAIARIGRAFGWSVTATSAAVTRIAVAHLAQAIREVSLDKGYDPRDFALLAFGGAGPLFAAEVAMELGINEVIIPRNAGVFSALGCLCADHSYEALRTVLSPATRDSAVSLRNQWEEIEWSLKREVASQGQVRIERSLDMRYVGEAFEITLRIEANPSDPQIVDLAVEKFHAEHQRLYGFTRTDPVQIVNARIKLIEPIDPPEWKVMPSTPGVTPLAKEVRPTGQLDGSVSDVPIFLRDDLHPGHEIEGPAIILDQASTATVPAHQRLRVDTLGNLIIST